MTTEVDSEGRRLKLIQSASMKVSSAKGENFWMSSLSRLENPRNELERNKPWMVTTSWGSVGTTGQKTMKSFTSEHCARAFLGQRKRDKVRKGYVDVPLAEVRVKTVDKVGTTEVAETDWDV